MKGGDHSVFSDTIEITVNDSVWTDYAAGSYEGGDGSEDSPYLIASAEQLALLARETNEDHSQYTDVYFRLTEDIDLSGHSWEPIGNSAQSFLGGFDGNGHTISGLYIDAPDEDNQGLFGYLGDDETASAEVKNIGIVNSFIEGKNAVGSIAGISYGTISNIYADGFVTGSGMAGGIAGSNIGTVQNCYSECAVRAASQAVLWAAIQAQYKTATITVIYAQTPHRV